MTSVCGHVMNLDFIGKYNSWDRVDPVSCLRLTKLYLGINGLISNFACRMSGFRSSLLLNTQN